MLKYIKHHAVLVTAVILVVVAGSVIAGRASHKAPAASNTSNQKNVTLVNASDFRMGGSTVSVDGIIESLAQADLKSQFSAPIASVQVDIGDRVFAGQIIATLQNSDISAQLEQAKATLALAKGQYTTSGVSLESAKQGMIDKLISSYITVNQVINSSVDPLLYNNNGSGGRLYDHIADTTLTSKIDVLHSDISGSLQAWKNAVYSLSIASTANDITSVIAMTRKNLSTTDQLLGSVLTVLNDSARYATPDYVSFYSTWKSTISTAQTSISTASANITTAETALSTNQSTHATPAEAQVSVAEASVKNLEAQLAKTVIRSPIGGKVASLPLRVGELASVGQLIATVVGEGGLEIKANASEKDLPRIRSGAHVSIGARNATGSTTITGIVSNVSPSVDPITKKAQVEILINDPTKSGLIVGQNISASIQASNTQTSSIGPVVYRLPIQNVKIIPGNAYVYTVNTDSSKIEQHEVVLGEVSGDFVEVTAGLSDDMRIASPVYGLAEGEVVVPTNL